MQKANHKTCSYQVGLYSGPIVKRLTTAHINSSIYGHKNFRAFFSEVLSGSREFSFSSDKYHTTFSCKSNELRFVNLKWELHMRRN